MLYLSVSKAQRTIISLLGFLALVSCGDNNNQSVVAASNSQAITLEASSTNQAALEGTTCGPKIQYYTIFDYSLSTNFDATVMPWQAFELVLNASDIDYQAAAKSFKLSFSLFNNAIACPISFESGTQNVVEFKVTSNDTFSAQYPAGSDITALVEPTFVQTTNYYDEGLASTVTELFAESTMAPASLGLKLNTAPEFPYQSFTVEVTLDDGQSFTLQTGPITFSF